MRSLLDLALANPFMRHYKQKCLQSFEVCEVILYRRYIDDTVFVLNSEHDAEKYHVFLNQ